MENNESLEEQHAEIKKPMSETQWQRLKNMSFQVSLLGRVLGGALMVVGAILPVEGLFYFGTIVEWIGIWTFTLSVFSPIWIGIYAFFRYRKSRREAHTLCASLLLCFGASARIYY